MQKLKQQFVSSLQELKNMKTLAATAMLIAIAVVLGFFATIQIGDFIKIGFSFLANEITAFAFGPVVGGLMAGIADITKYLVKPTGPFFFGFTFNAILGGVIYGIVLYQKPFSIKRIFTAKLLVTVIVNLCFNTLWLSILYGNSFLVILPMRALKSAIMLPIETILFYMVAKALTKAKVFAFMKAK